MRRGRAQESSYCRRRESMGRERVREGWLEDRGDRLDEEEDTCITYMRRRIHGTDGPDVNIK